MDGAGWHHASQARSPRPKRPKPEVTINLRRSWQVDLLVAEGFYSNRTDFIRTAIRNQLTTHGEALKQVVARKTFVLGLQSFGVAELEAARTTGQLLDIRVLGLAIISPDVSAELALAAIQSITVLGALQASPAVKAALASRIH